MRAFCRDLRAENRLYQGSFACFCQALITVDYQILKGYFQIHLSADRFSLKLRRMRAKPPFYKDDPEWPARPFAREIQDREIQDRGPYDRDPVPEVDLWFLPEPLAETDLPPLPRADRGPLPRSADWARTWARTWAVAEAALARDLAGVTLLFGALDERLRHGVSGGEGGRGDGWRHRLALIAAAEISWAAGDRVAQERLALWAVLRLSGPQQDAQALARAGWALRRLEGGPTVELDSIEGLLAFFDRQHLTAAAGDSGLADLIQIGQSLHHLHPVTQAAALFQGWRMLGGDTAQGDVVRHIEAAVLAARLGARIGARQGPGDGAGAMFMPLGLTGLSDGHSGNAVQDQLALWFGRVEQAIRAALRHLDQLARWQGCAQAAMAGLQGRTPGLLIGVLAAWPQVTAAMAEELTGTARATVQRNLTLLQKAGLIREVTGQGRYRVWTARI